MARKFTAAAHMKLQITFQRNAGVDGSVRDDRGQVVDSWSDFKKTRASREHLTGDKLRLARDVHHNATDRFKLPFQDVRLSDRIVANGKIYQILDIDNYLDCNRELHILAGSIR